MNEKMKLLEQVKADILQQNVCSDLAEQAIQLVMGAGNEDADIVFIGEAPGKKEDERGVPFVGAAGKFLDTMLDAAEMDRGDVYITNIVKYRPPDNRDPSADEKAAFLPYLLRQLEIIDPKVVVALGRHSMEFFLPDATIGEVHGQSFGLNIDGFKFQFVPLYHPAAALYNGSLRQTLMNDFLSVSILIK